MKKACLIITILLVSICFAAVQDTADTSATRQKPVIKRVLIASGGSRLEKVVIKSLAGMITDKDCDVTVIDLNDMQKMNPDSFGAVVVMSAVKETKLHEGVQNFLNQYDRDKPAIEPATVIISTISGEGWQGKESGVDAVTQASSTLEPKRIALKLYNKVAEILDLK